MAPCFVPAAKNGPLEMAGENFQRKDTKQRLRQVRNWEIQRGIKGEIKRGKIREERSEKASRKTA